MEIPTGPGDTPNRARDPGEFLSTADRVDVLLDRMNGKVFTTDEKPIRELLTLMGRRLRSLGQAAEDTAEILWMLEELSRYVDGLPDAPEAA